MSPQEPLTLDGRRLVIAGEDRTGRAVARQALRAGAHVTLVVPPSGLPRCRRLAEELRGSAHAVCADLERPEDVAALGEHLRCGYGTVDGAVLALAAEGSGARALAALARAVAPLLPPAGGSLVALASRRDSGPPPDLEAAAGELARELGGAGGRVNVVVAGPRSRAWAADAVCFLLSPLARGTTGQVLHVGDRGRAEAATPAGRP